MRWDIFCNVIDNYGDIGVCWRLARQLATEHDITVRLWVDDLPSLQHLCPEVDPHTDLQHKGRVEVRTWQSPFPDTEPAEVVIEAFGCELPENYLQSMARAAQKPVWINLEYLSAESWVEGCHALPSPHPQLALTRYFFFPGFTPATGGLLRETSLLSRRRQQSPLQCWQALKLPCPAPHETSVSLFCYDTAPIYALLNAWTHATRPVRCYLPEGKAISKVADYFGRAALATGDSVTRGNLTLHVTPFLRQEDYDLLLWACNVNFVRGEDSFVRAQWAQKPMFWQIYKQDENAHLVKLDAFLDLYCASANPPTAEFMRSFHHAWNNDGHLDWEGYLMHQSALESHAIRWSDTLAQQADLASNLVIFCKNLV